MSSHSSKLSAVGNKRRHHGEARQSAAQAAGTSNSGCSRLFAIVIKGLQKLLAALWFFLGLTLAVVFGCILSQDQHSSRELSSNLEYPLGNHSYIRKTQCDDGWITYEGSESCYLFSHELPTLEQRMLNWDDASRVCADRKSRLVCVDDLEEHNFVSLHAEAAGGYWTGLNDRGLEGHFLCVSDGGGTPKAGLIPRPWQGFPSYQPDDFSSPAEDCVAISGPFQWSWQSCDTLVDSVLCELPRVNVSREQTNGCPEGWRKPYPLKESCYKLLNSDSGLDFASAAKVCKELHPNASVLSVESLLENEVLAFEFGFGKTWLDLKLRTPAPSTASHSSAGDATSSPSDAPPSSHSGFANFILPERDLAEYLQMKSRSQIEENTCAVMVQSNWNDVMCSLHLFFVCEREFSRSSSA